MGDEKCAEEVLAKGFCSLEEHMQEYTGLFLMLQQEEAAWAAFPERRRQLELREERTELFLPAVYLREYYTLTETEYWTVMFAFCCELEAGLCMDFWEKYKESRPTLQYILHLLSPVLPVTFSYVAGFYKEGSAFQELLELHLEENGFSQQPLRLKPEVFCFLLTGELSPKEGERPFRLAERQDRHAAFRLGRLIECSCEPEEMILPADCQRQLDTVLRLARAWQGEKGLQLLFHGSSGTGKTMAASVLARQLGLPLFKVDISRVFDKYIGETEKHVDEIFRIAGHNHYLLFFDEADALFAKRTAVRDSHDRYANVSAAYLLQRMEDYSGILILATNLKDHFDDAFVRRIRFVIRFRNPDEEVRKRLWTKALEGEPQVAEDVDFGALAAAAQLSPARICSAAHVARLLASCDESPVVTRGHLREALELEAGKDETTVGRI